MSNRKERGEVTSVKSKVMLPSVIFAGDVAHFVHHLWLRFAGMRSHASAAWPIRAKWTLGEWQVCVKETVAKTYHFTLRVRRGIE